MKQRYSFTYLLYHLVFRTKHREAVLRNFADEQRLLGLFKEKAHQLDGRIEEFGSWYDHVHVLARGCVPHKPLYPHGKSRRVIVPVTAHWACPKGISDRGASARGDRFEVSCRNASARGLPVVDRFDSK